MVNLSANFTIPSQTAPKKDFTYAVGEDADKAALLSQLLKSKSKADLETANKMIKVLVCSLITHYLYNLNPGYNTKLILCPRTW